MKSLHFQMQRIPERLMLSFPSKTPVKQELEVDEQSENRSLSSDTVINLVQKSESRPSASTSSTES